jgi:hypothetical protein
LNPVAETQPFDAFRVSSELGQEVINIMTFIKQQRIDNTLNGTTKSPGAACVFPHISLCGTTSLWLQHFLPTQLGLPFGSTYASLA